MEVIITWDPGTPDGTLTAKDNRPKFEDNWEYIETRMQRDHYFDEDADKDGHFKQMGVDDIANTGTPLAGGTTPSDPADVSDGTVAMYYARAKTATEAPDSVNQMANGYLASRNTGDTDTHYKQLGMSAMVVFRVAGNSITQNDGNPWDYQHNVSNVVRSNGSSGGVYTITFTTPMPNANYLVIATAETPVSGDGGRIYVLVERNGKTAESVIIKTLSTNGNRTDIQSLSVIIIGA